MKEVMMEFIRNSRHMPTELELAGGMWTIKAGRNKAKANYSAGPRFIKHYSLHFIIGGKLALTYNDQQRQILGANDSFCLFPDITYQYEVVDELPPRTYWYAFDGPQAPMLVERCGYSPEQPYIFGNVNTELVDAIDQLEHYLMSNKNKEPQQRDLKLSLLGYQLFDKLFLPLDRQREEAESKQAKRLRKAKEYLELHYMESISVGEAADYVDWHRAHFSKIFTSVYGVSPMQFLKELRMNNAQRLLQNTDHSITEISLSLGYQDLFTFTRAFTKHFGLSPSKYREQANLSPAAP